MKSNLKAFYRNLGPGRRTIAIEVPNAPSSERYHFFRDSHPEDKFDGGYFSIWVESAPDFKPVSYAHAQRVLRSWQNPELAAREKARKAKWNAAARDTRRFQLAQTVKAMRDFGPNDTGLATTPEVQEVS